MVEWPIVPIHTALTSDGLVMSYGTTTDGGAVRGADLRHLGSGVGDSSDDGQRHPDRSVLLDPGDRSVHR